MPHLFIHNDAEADLEALWHTAPQAAARIAALLEELKGNADLLDRLTQHHFGHYRTAPFHVSKWVEQWNKGKDLWRLKVWDLEAKGLRQRVVYAFIPGMRRYYVLGIVPREFNYESSHPLSRRILAAYANL